MALESVETTSIYCTVMTASKSIASQDEDDKTEDESTTCDRD